MARQQKGRNARGGRARGATGGGGLMGTMRRRRVAGYVALAVAAVFVVTLFLGYGVRLPRGADVQTSTGSQAGRTVTVVPTPQPAAGGAPAGAAAPTR